MKIRGVSLIELLVAMTLGLMLLAALVYVLVGAKQLSTGLGQQAEIEEQVSLVRHLLAGALAGAGSLGCLDRPDGVFNLLNTDWAHLGLLNPWPGVDILVDPSLSDLFSNMDDLSSNSHGVVIRGYARPLARLTEALGDHRGEAQLHSLQTRVNSGDVVLLSDCQQGAMFSATRTWHSQGRLRFSWDTGSGAWDNAAVAQTMAGDPIPTDLDQLGSGFAPDAQLWGPSGLLLYVAPSRVVSADSDSEVYALWQKTVGGRAMELMTGVHQLQARYGAWTDQHGGQMGYFDGDALPADAQVVLLLLRISLVAHRYDDVGVRPVEIAIPMASGTGG